MHNIRIEKQTKKVKIPTIQCEFCSNCVDNDNPSFGIQRLWAKVSAVTKCGCENTWHICPECIRKNSP